MPIGPLRVRPVPNQASRRVRRRRHDPRWLVSRKVMRDQVDGRIKVGCSLERDMDRPARRKLDFTIMCSGFQAVHTEIHQMTASVRNIAAPAAHGLQPFCIGKFSIHFRVHAPLSHTRVRNARKIRLARHARSETHIQRLVPYVQLPNVRRVHGGDEVRGVGVGYVHDVLVRSNSIEPRHLVIRQFG